MGQLESKDKVVEISSKDLDDNKLSLADLNEKSKTSFLSLNIKQNQEAKVKFQRKRKIEYDFVDSFIEVNDIEESLKYLIRDYDKYEDYFNNEFDRLNLIFNPKVNIQKTNINKMRKEFEKNYFLKYEEANGFTPYSVYNFPDKENNQIGKRDSKSRRKSSKSNSKLTKLTNKKLEFDQLNELDKIQKDFEKEKLSLNDPDLMNNLNLLIHKYENKSFDHCKQFFLTKK